MRFGCPHCDAKNDDYLALCAHVTEKHLEQTFLCGRRAEGGASVMGQSRDYWRVEPNGDRCCSYCGSLHEEDFTAIMQGYVDGKEGFDFGTTTKNYKVYARRPGVSNASQGGIKFYLMHVDKTHPEFKNRCELFDKAVKLANARLRERFNIPETAAVPKPAPAAPAEGKFRPHLRPDGIPTRADMQHWTPAERAIAEAMAAVERAGGSPALTDAVNLLGKARDRVADHVEGREPPAS